MGIRSLSNYVAGEQMIPRKGEQKHYDVEARNQTKKVSQYD